MLKQMRYIGFSIMLSMCTLPALAQVAMPDTVCVGTDRIYKVSDPTNPISYTWKIDGVVQSSVTNELHVTWHSAGVFNLSVQAHSAGGCDGDVITGVVNVRSLPVAEAGAGGTFCFGKTVQLSGSGGDFYQWMPANYLSNATLSNPVLKVTSAGLYTLLLDVTDKNGCKSMVPDTVVVKLLPEAKLFAGNDTTVTANQYLQLNAIDVNNSGFVSYAWSPTTGLNDPTRKDPVAYLNQSINYTVTAKTAEGCIATDGIKIQFFVSSEIYVPSAFTPNNDGLNDVLKPILAGIKTLKIFSVFNRFGQVVFTTTVPGKGWDGTLNGIKQDSGTYVWIAEGIDYKGNLLVRKGTTVLIR